MTTGTMFLMWLGEQITERGVGNGISMIIFSGIVAGLPGRDRRHVRAGEHRRDEPLFALLLVIAVVIARDLRSCVFVERAQRRITVNYAKRQVGRRMYAGQISHLPFKLNMSGVIPPIFASSLLLFRRRIVSFFGTEPGRLARRWLQSIAAARSAMASRCTWCCTPALIMFFCFFYTALVFNSRETADNLKKSGAFIPGIRPGPADRRVHRQGADAPDAVGRALCHRGVPAAGDPGLVDKACRSISVAPRC